MSASVQQQPRPEISENAAATRVPGRPAALPPAARHLAFAALCLLAVAPAAADEAVVVGTEDAARRVCVRVAELDAPPPVLPGVRILLVPAGDPAADVTAELPACAPYSDRCGPADFRTRANGEACFDSVEPGDYFVRTRLESWWDNRTGPIRVPVRDFDRLDLDIALDVNWEQRNTVVVGHGHHEPDESRARPLVPPEKPAGAVFTGFARNLCVAVWRASDDFEALPTAWVTLEPVGGAEPGTAPPPPGGASGHRAIRVTDERGVACFDGVAGGRYVATASLEGFWDATVGPFDVPAGFEWLDLRVGLGLQWVGDVLWSAESPRRP